MCGRREGIVFDLSRHHAVNDGEMPFTVNPRVGQDNKVISVYISDLVHPTVSTSTSTVMTRAVVSLPHNTHSSMSASSQPRHTSSNSSIRAQFLNNTLKHAYTMPPGGLLNFTMTEIIVFLPHLYKDSGIATRFLNNNITTAVHFEILSTYRELNLPNENAEIQAREIITEGYRKAMRVWDREWRKATHTAPPDWNSNVIAMDGFVPYEAMQYGYRAPAPVPFKSLARGVTMMPQGSDAGDLTRALEFALVQTETLMYPDDIHKILGAIGQTQVTLQHTDRRVVRRYTESLVMKKHQQITPPPSAAARQIVPRETTPQPVVVSPQPVVNVSPPTPNAQACGYTGFAPANQSVAVSAAHVFLELGQTQEHYSNYTEANYTTTIHPNAYPPVAPNTYYEVDKLFCLPPHIEQHSTPPSSDQDIDVCSSNSADIDELLRPYLPQDNPEPTFLLPESGLLRDIPESVLDGSDFSRAVQFAKQSDQVNTDWHVDEVHVLSELLKFDGKFEDGWLDLDASE